MDGWIGLDWMKLCCGICWCQWICPSQLLWLSFLEKILRTIPPNKASEVWRNDLSCLEIFHHKASVHLSYTYAYPRKKELQWAIQNPNFTGWNNTSMTICPASQFIMSFLTNGNSSKTNTRIFSNTETRWAASRNPPPDLQKIPLGATWLEAQLLPPQLNQPIDMRDMSVPVSGNITHVFSSGFFSGIGWPIS